jgi:hypothetical protein
VFAAALEDVDRTAFLPGTLGHALYNQAVAEAFAERLEVVDPHAWADLQDDLVPVDGSGDRIVQEGGRWVVNGDADDSNHIRLYAGAGDGYVVEVGHPGPDGELVYERQALTRDQADDLLIRSGGGDNVIEVHPEVDLAVSIVTGDGDDLIGWEDGNPAYRQGGGGDQTTFLGGGDNVVYGGAGDDRIYGGDGDDYIQNGGGDNHLEAGGGAVNVIYGGAGDDVIIGSATGDDVLLGGSGDDRIEGVGGDNVIFGGSGDDLLIGGEGRDRLITGEGTNTVIGSGDDTVISGGGDRVHGAGETVTIEIDPAVGDTAISLERPGWMSDAEYAAWRERVEIDLDLFRATPSGQEGMRALDEAVDGNRTILGRQREIVIAPYLESGDRDRPTSRYTTEVWLFGGDGLSSGNSLGGNYASPPQATDGDAVVNYGPAHIDALDSRPPAASLYHELAHSFDQLTGGTEGGTYTEMLLDADGEVLREREAPMAEVNAVGIVDADGEIITRPSAGGVDHPPELTENALREELGWAHRPSYTMDPASYPEGARLRFVIDGVVVETEGNG